MGRLLYPPQPQFNQVHAHVRHNREQSPLLVPRQDVNYIHMCVWPLSPQGAVVILHMEQKGLAIHSGIPYVFESTSY